MKRILYGLTVVVFFCAFQMGTASADQCLPDETCSSSCGNYEVVDICDCDPLNADDVVIFFDKAVDQKLVKAKVPRYIRQYAKESGDRKALRKAKKDRIANMRALLEQARNLETYFPMAACSVMQAAYDRCDGNKSIPDFVKGSAIDGLRCRIEAVLGNLGCE